ncbi:MAG TPA: PDZ domain-containing protein, partial [Ilumatobacteraceae bacterium]|nr:PDZ domain-containing protein [Ilumatobacteraceae bacterium]
FAAPTAVTSRANDLSDTVVTARPDTFVATTALETRLPTTTPRATTVATTAAPDSTGSIVDEDAETTAATTSAELVDVPPVAVGVGDSLVITTARAVDGRTSITLTDGNGNPHDAAVLMVDRDRGLAVLSADAAAVTTSYGIGPAASAGDSVTVLGATPTAAKVMVGADGRMTLDGWPQSTPEGAPIVNGDGQLVGICSRGSAGVEIIGVANVAAMLAPSKPVPGAAWLGVHVTANDQGAPTIDKVDPEGPAAGVGVAVGDLVTAIDGIAIHNVDELKVAISTHQPDQDVTLTLTHADQTAADVVVTLGSTPSM